MKHYVGLDVSLKEVSICVFDAEGVAKLGLGELKRLPPLC